MKERVAIIENALIQEINKLCSCGLTAENMHNGSFSCDGLIEQVVYRGRILGNDKYNSQDLVSLVQSWVESDTGAIHTDFFRFNVDSTCSANLDSLDSPDCAVSERSTDNVVSVNNNTDVTTGEAIAIIIGFFIILILVGVVILQSFVLFRKKKSNRSSTFQGAVKFKNQRKTSEEDKEPFAVLGPSDEDDTVTNSEYDLEKPPVM